MGGASDSAWAEPAARRGCPFPHPWPGLWPPAPRARPLSRPLTMPLSLSSVVLMASRGRYVSRGLWTRVLEKLGADKGLRLKGKGFGLGTQASAAWEGMGMVTGSRGRRWRGAIFSRVSAQVIDPCFSEKMAFVGFKGSFRPTWVNLNTDDHEAKIFQVVPIPVVKKRKL